MLFDQLLIDGATLVIESAIAFFHTSLITLQFGMIAIVMGTYNERLASEITIFVLIPFVRFEEIFRHILFVS
jgi:hypothetical protein